ncbi:MAG: hypothetical protein FWD71_00705 [Oscillospiraceae bacterium]|nr:hypothetical protein [Oscillospiraceae bacterium]
MLSLDYILQGIFAGVIVAVLVVGYNKLVIGRFVKALIKAEAVHPAFAKTFEDLKIRKNIFISFALRNRGTLRKIVLERKDNVLDVDSDGQIIGNTHNNIAGAYYIPEDKLYRAGRMYGGKDVDVLMLAAVIIVFFIFSALVLLYLPSLLNYASTVFSNMFGTNNGG